MAQRFSVFPTVRRALSRACNGVTLGVRGLVFDEAGGVLLLEHTYVKGWHLPGGGVERAESAEMALAREMIEEAGVNIIGAPALLSIHDNGRHFPGDLVLVYRIQRWSLTPATSRGEIARLAFFPIDGLPVDVTAATRRRIFEATSGAIPDLTW